MPVIRIARAKPRPGGDEEPWLYDSGYQLADPALGSEWHHAKNAIYVQTLKEAADRIEHHRLAIRMGRVGLRPSLVRPSGLRITR
jgi:hypothetical protein